ncbi:MAG: stealth family protein [Comamonas thiooxydans]
MRIRKIKKLFASPLIFARDYLLKIRPLILNELDIGLLSQDEVISIQKNYIYLSDRLDITTDKIDVVYTWVNDSDDEWQRKIKKYKDNLNPNYENSSKERYSNSNEIFYSVRSVLKFMPWVNRIYIVTDNQKHPDLDCEEKVEFISHSSIIPEEYLPTFNSHVIEAYLHKISGLSENFIYFNDDVFVARHLDREHFFKKNDLASAFFSKKKISNIKRITPTAKAAINSKRLLEESFKCVIDSYFVHTYFPLKKSVYEFVWGNYKDEIESFLSQKFRSEKDLNLASFLVPWASFLLGKSTADLDICYYFNHRSAASELYWKVLLKKEVLPHSFCANDFYGGNNISKSDGLENKLNDFYHE